MRSRHLVVLCLQGFGDALEATPLVEQLRRNVPNARITVVTLRPQVRDLFRALPRLADAVVYVPYWQRGLARSFRSIASLPFRTRSEASFLTFPSARAEYALFASAIASRAHYSHAYPLDRFAAIVERGRTHRIPIARKHNVLRNLDLLAAAGFDVYDPTAYVVPEEWKAPRSHPRSVLLHVGSIAHNGLEAKRWPLESFVALGAALRRRAIDVRLISGPAEREDTERAARELGGAPIVSGDIPSVARAIASAGAVVANDNGIAHLSAAVGTPTIALMGPTPVEFGPYGPHAVAFRPSSCPPCFDFVRTDARCALNIDYACLKRDIRVADVVDAVTQLLSDAADVAVI